MKRPRIFVTVMVIAGLALAGAAGWKFYTAQNDAPQAKGERPVVAAYVTVEPAVRREVVETLAVTGTLVPRQDVLAGPEIDGLRIVELLAEEGDKVEKGQVLVRLSRETLDALVAQSDAALARSDATIAQTRSQVAQAQANVTLTASELTRAQTLLARGASTQAVVDQKQNAARGARAQLDALRSGLEGAEAEKKNLQAQRRELMIRVARTEVRAPAAGVISRRSAKLGALASAAAPEPLFRIIADGVIELDAEIPEHRLLQVHEGQAAQIILADDTKVAGKVRLISPEVNQTTRMGRVRITLTQDSRARAGSFARGSIELRRAQSVTVPTSAVIYDEGKTSLQIVEGAAVRVRKVEVGLVSGARAEILSGLKEDEIVIVRAGPFLREGDAVSPVSVKQAER